MSSWLQKRVVIWCALAVLLGGTQWFSSVRAQNGLMPLPASTPEAAAANFMAQIISLSSAGSSMGAPTNLAGIVLEESISRVQRQKVKEYRGKLSEALLGAMLWELITAQRNQRYKGQITDQSAGKAVVELREVDNAAALPPIVCIAEDGGWRVDFFGTYARWKSLSDLDRDTRIAELTGEISLLLAQNPERVRVVNDEHENVRRSSCQSNLKQVGLGLLQYQQDYDEKLPPAHEWAEVIQPYIANRKTFHCPNVTDPDGFGYAFNARLSHKNINFVDKNTNVAQMVMIYETTDLRWNAYGLGENPAFRHFDGANYASVDGHVEWYEKTHPPQFTFGAKQ